MSQVKPAYIMLLLKNSVTIVVFVICGYVSFGQSIKVQDDAFAEVLCEKFPLAMDAGCIMLDTLAARDVYTGVYEMRLNGRGISSADEVVFFTEADTLWLGNNELSTFPMDLSMFKSLGRLSLFDNKLTEAPNIKYTNVNDVDTAVKLVYLQGNLISELPPSWSEANSMTQVVDLENNNLSSISAFHNYDQIRRLDLRSNKLGFESLVPVISNPKWGQEQFDLFPQKEFEVDIDTTVTIGSVQYVDISANYPTNIYCLKKDGVPVISNSEGVFEIQIDSISDAGVYSFEIRNSNFVGPDEVLFSKAYELRIYTEGSNVSENDVGVFSPNGDGVSDSYFVKGSGKASFLDKSGRELRVEQLPFEWSGDDSSGKRLAPGLYIIERAKGDLEKVIIAY